MPVGSGNGQSMVFVICDDRHWSSVILHPIVITPSDSSSNFAVSSLGFNREVSISISVRTLDTFLFNDSDGEVPADLA